LSEGLPDVYAADNSYELFSLYFRIQTLTVIRDPPTFIGTERKHWIADIWI